MRRLWAPDKSGAGESSPILMEERETEEVGGRSSKKNYSHHQRRLPATVYRGKKLSLLSVQLLSLPPTSLGPGEEFPRRWDSAGKGAGIPLCDGDSVGRGRRLSQRKKDKAKNKTWVFPHGDSRSCFRGSFPEMAVSVLSLPHSDPSAR